MDPIPPVAPIPSTGGATGRRDKVGTPLPTVRVHNIQGNEGNALQILTLSEDDVERLLDTNLMKNAAEQDALRTALLALQEDIQSSEKQAAVRDLIQNIKVADSSAYERDAATNQTLEHANKVAFMDALPKDYWDGRAR
jgi:hypothetical protein